MEDPTRARFPDVPATAGHYESYYLRAAHPSEPLGIWIRYTVHKRPAAQPKGSLWFTLFDGSADGPTAVKITHPDARSAGWIDIASSTFGPDAVTGMAGEASWNLTYAGSGEPLFHLPRDWMYRAPIPRTKTLSPQPSVLFSGTVSVHGRDIQLDGWPGMVGHNWGAEHAERWIWMHGLGFDGQGLDTWLDIAIGRVKVGPLTTPWIANGALSLGGERHRLGGVERIRSTEVSETPTGCQFALAGPDLSVRGSVRSEAKNFVGWVYADPDGREHNTVNCSISHLKLTVTRPGRPNLTLETTSGASYELGMRETNHGIPIQPFPDG